MLGSAFCGLGVNVLDFHRWGARCLMYPYEV